MVRVYRSLRDHYLQGYCLGNIPCNAAHRHLHDEALSGKSIHVALRDECPSKAYEGLDTTAHLPQVGLLRVQRVARQCAQHGLHTCVANTELPIL